VLAVMAFIFDFALTIMLPFGEKLVELVKWALAAFDPPSEARICTFVKDVYRNKERKMSRQKSPVVGMLILAFATLLVTACGTSPTAPTATLAPTTTTQPTDIHTCPRPP
jgi:hypothetical protein